MTDKKITWRELEAQGVKRCNAMFTSGKRCRRRASDAFDHSWCNKHGPIIKAHTDFALRAMSIKPTKEEED